MPLLMESKKFILDDKSFSFSFFLRFCEERHFHLKYDLDYRFLLQVAVKREIGGDRTSAYYVLAAAWVALMAISTPLWYFESLILKCITRIMLLEKGLYNSFVLLCLNGKPAIHFLKRLECV
jgi:hypothetical protein